MSKPDNVTKKEAVFIRLTERVKGRVERAAKANGQTVSEFFREAALAKLRREEGRANG